MIGYDSTKISTFSSAITQLARHCAYLLPFACVWYRHAVFSTVSYSGGKAPRFERHTVGQGDQGVLLQTGYSYGFGFVQYVNPGDMEKAIAKFNGYNLKDKRVKVSVARPLGKGSKDTNLYITNVPKLVLLATGGAGYVHSIQYGKIKLASDLAESSAFQF